MKNFRKVAVVQWIYVLLTTPLFAQNQSDTCHPCDEIHRMDSAHIVVWHSGVQATHLHAEEHNCSYDYKEEGKILLKKQIDVGKLEIKLNRL